MCALHAWPSLLLMTVGHTAGRDWLADYNVVARPSPLYTISFIIPCSTYPPIPHPPLAPLAKLKSFIYTLALHRVQQVAAAASAAAATVCHLVFNNSYIK